MRYGFSRLAGILLLTVALLGFAVFIQGRGTIPVAYAQIAVQGTVAQNDVLHYQGQLFNPNGGQPLANQTANLSFRFYGQASGGSPLWQEDKSITTNVDGLFNSLIGSNTSLNFDLFDGRELYLGVAINGEEGAPRLPVTYVPYALWARNADRVDGYSAHDLLRGITLAYGEIDENGNKISGTDNWSSRIVVVSFENVYEVRINGIDYKEREYVTLVTPGCARPRLMGTGSSEGALLIDVWDHDGARRTDCKFQFVTFRKP